MSRQEVEKIARLARLSLSDGEIEQYRSQLSEVLTYIDKLNEVDTSNVEPTAQVTGLTNVIQDDVASNKPDPKKLLANSPMQQAQSIKVRAVFDE